MAFIRLKNAFDDILSDIGYLSYVLTWLEMMKDGIIPNKNNHKQ